MLVGWRARQSAFAILVACTVRVKHGCDGCAPAPVSQVRSHSSSYQSSGTRQPTINQSDASGAEQQVRPAPSHLVFCHTLNNYAQHAAPVWKCFGSPVTHN